MRHFIIVGADLHDRTIVYRVAVDRGKSVRRTVANTPEGRQRMIQQLQALADRQGGAAIYVGFEAGPHGFWFYDEMENAGIRCAPLAPTEMERDSDARVQKNDDKDSERILEVVRAWVLAGKENTPLVAVPDPETRRDREPVRMRVRIGCQVAKTKTRIRSLLARHDLKCDGAFDRKHIEALHKLAGKIDPSLGVVLKQMLRELKCWELRDLSRGGTRPSTGG